MTDTADTATAPTGKPRSPVGVPILTRYTQPQDDEAEDPDGQQYLEIESCNGGAGTFLVIRSERWAIDPDDIDALCEALKTAAVHDPLQDRQTFHHRP